MSPFDMCEALMVMNDEIQEMDEINPPLIERRDRIEGAWRSAPFIVARLEGRQGGMNWKISNKYVDG